ncbi:MAG: MBL fold metallo-hydrolase [Anaerolineales bacterium]|nr:MBL fold metallo-hydrolase [Anaerolineales bacterium]
MEIAQNFYSKHFTIHALTDSVLAAVAKDGGWAISNAGLIDLGGQIIVFDTFMTPSAAEDLRKFSVEHLGRPPTMIVNSHYHNDHIWGNQVFADEAVILSSLQTRELITTAGQEEFDYYSANSALRLEALQGEFQTAPEEEKKDLLLWIEYYQALVEELPHTRVHLPQITFENRFKIHGTKYSAECFCFEGGHTGSDTVLYLAETGIVLMSDLLFVNCHPYLADGDLFKLLTTLGKLSQFDADQFVPGHGAVGTRKELDLMIEYVEQCIEISQSLVKSGDADEDGIKEVRVPAQFQHWQFPRFFQINIQFLCQALKDG